MLRDRRIRSRHPRSDAAPAGPPSSCSATSRAAPRFRLRPLALGGVLAAGAAPLFLGLTGIAALSDEGPHEALEVVLLLLLLRFIPSARVQPAELKPSHKVCATHSGTWAVG